ncbi:haloacid dehalogenase type II [Leptolyngbya sp. FACHB-541]|uniref:haloacid dehalogenase type II n=1 Tax=Leptolyngbya sp. FACHB-541 TaxID=2692810 RepID=UPI001687BFC0|nr:haloacid dehalogenase type II [Leptolyngbya sp. FACHB-541]MBD1869799.1 haloacid dehalogenase type II [Cyanobacteria bacterium FACHB-471]MBD1997333.1 haloacid dehalogenase type II [Leptolyngbya sp. FACHB-541]
MLDFSQYEALTFDCYGTIINWEQGILEAIKPVLAAYQLEIDDSQILELFAQLEGEIEAGEYQSYRSVLGQVMQQFGEKLGFVPTSDQLDCLANSIQNWQPFPDSIDALKRLKQQFKLVIISNIDDDLFAFTTKRLGVPFDFVITAFQAKSYKPSTHNFEFAFEKTGIPRDKILHVAQSIYHDIVPAKALGLSTVWVNRRHDQAGFGATLPASSQPDLEVPNLETLAKLAEGTA